MDDGETPFLTDFWYLALSAGALRPGRTTTRRIMDQPLLLGRTAAGRVFALHDVCPHRGIPLSYGGFDGREVACAYHGWRFGPDGRCTAIPSLAPGQEFDVARVGVRSYPCREVQGNIWVYFAADEAADGGDAADPPPDVPHMPAVGEGGPQVAISQVFDCDLDHAAFGLMDPTHAAFVHTSWWWKKKARILRLKEKAFEPAPLGWRMMRHPLPPENRFYRLLGRNVTTEITYRLPGLRIEHVEGDRHAAISLTALTPVGANRTEVHQCIYWTVPWLGLIRPVLKGLAGVFLAQDREMVVKQQDGLAGNPKLMMVDDADTQAKWFQQVKRELLRSRAENREFQNPVKARTLHWHS